MLTNIKLIASDIDGTLLDNMHEISPRTERALKTAMARGIYVVLATGRARTNRAVEVIEHLGLTTPAIFLQGGAVYEADGTLRHNHPFKLELARQIIEFGEGQGYTMVAYCGLEAYTPQRNYHTDLLIRYRETVPIEVGSLLKIWGDVPMNKLVFFADPDHIPPIRAQAEALFGGQMKAMMSLPTALELLPPQVSKGAALLEVMADLGVSAAETIAFGDAENDIEMLQVAGMGVAMGNAMPITQAVADHIAPRNDEDGLARVLEEFVL